MSRRKNKKKKKLKELTQKFLEDFSEESENFSDDEIAQDEVIEELIESIPVPGEDEVIESALDKLRKERLEKDTGMEALLETGTDEPEPESEIEPEELTTAALFQQSVPEISSEPILNAEKTQEMVRYEPEEPIAQTPLIQEAEVQPQKKSNKELQKKQFRAMLLVAGIVVLVGGLILAYLYKTMVYDPSVTITETQSEVYEILVEYADEYDMLSQSEQLELLETHADYEELSEYQQEQINEYFKEQTGQTYLELYNSLHLLDQNIKNESKSS